LDIVKEIATRFQGLDRAYGTYDLSKSKSLGGGEKVVGKPKTLQGTVDQDLWRRHIEGEQGLGIVPIMDNSMCHFGAIDIDVYKGLDVNKVVNDIYSQELPLVPCRSKSGGIHCFAFVKEAVSAALMKEKLSLFAALLGFGKAEIFPKQIEILAERGDIGQWINMPYFDHRTTNRYAYGKKCNPLTTEEFIAAIDKVWFSAADFNAFTVTLMSDISDGPPCLQTLITKGFSPGTRNDGLFNLAVYLKKSDADNFETAVDDYNTKYLDPQLSSSEIQNIVKSVKRKEYNYTCDKEPLKSCCNLQLCRTRKFGVGDMTGIVQMNGLTKFDSNPPVWFVDIDGGFRLELNTEDLQSQTKFQRKCMEGLNIMPPPVKMGVWQSIIQKLMENISIIEAPSDASPKGLFFEYLERFCTSRAQARVKDELLLGKPWTEKGKHYFRLLDFMAFLERHRFKEFKVNKIGSMLKEVGGEHHFFKIKGKGINVWSIPEFAKQTEAFDTPDIKDEEVF
jgi:hypothetical protein